MDTPLVSVIIPVKDSARFLSCSLNSVLEQDYRPLEIIVVDGHSRDRTVEIAQSFPYVRIIHQPGHGISQAWNDGLDAAQGALAAFLSHDDLWAPHKLRLQVHYLMEHPDIQYTITRFKYFVEPDCAIPPGFRQELLDGDHIGRIMETLVARTAVFAIIGTFDTQLTTAEDVDWYARANDSGISMALVPEVLLYKRLHENNLSLHTGANNRNLLQALRQSIQRKRQQAIPGKD